MKLLKLKAMLIMLAMFGLVLNSCEDSGSDPVEGDDPVITAIAPVNPAIGDVITITGANYGDSRDGDYVMFGDVKPADADYKKWEDNTIEVVVPAGAKTGDVVVHINEFKSKAHRLVIGAPAAATNVMATSHNSTEVLLKWDASPSAADDAVVYDVVVKSEGVDANTVATVEFDALPYTVTSLTEGTVYDFSIVAKYKGGENMAEAATVTWSPASRFEKNIDENIIKIYETASDKGSGLDLFDTEGEAPKSLRITNIANWNIGLCTKDDKIMFGSARALDYSTAAEAQITQISGDYYANVESMDDIFDSKALSSGTFESAAYDLSDDNFNGNKNLVFVFRTQNPDADGKYNYAKVMVKRAGTGFLQGEDKNRYIELVVSYQKVAGVPYAKK